MRHLPQSRLRVHAPVKQSDRCARTLALAGRRGATCSPQCYNRALLVARENFRCTSTSAEHERRWHSSPRAGRLRQSHTSSDATSRGAESPPPRRLDGGDVDLLHRHHRVERTLRFTATGRECLAQRSRNDLPGEAPAVLAPPALAFLAAIAD